MNKKEANSIVSEHLARYRSRPYAELASWAREDRIDTAEAVGPSGTRYQIEVRFFWDAKPEGDVRVCASIDDGGISAFVPLTEDFILSPEGKFVGE
jgi:nanoRNase/pAp phosphatase (c-di-AMP/oligoRNAs hydrolase)